MREMITLPLDDVEDMRNEIFCLNIKNDRLTDELNGYKHLIDKLNLIAPDKVSEAIDMQEGSKSDE
ncbi:hypothetical protein [Sporolactobacillus terrae]|uniref:hypothetical protein n=1 Tax=Sporolactobacillus terrae TaxID=269673 RepID=UPI00048D6C95|nr:hypothetical protein [Sporolactobacillus terrae]